MSKFPGKSFANIEKISAAIQASQTLLQFSKVPLKKSPALLLCSLPEQAACPTAVENAAAAAFVGNWWPGPRVGHHRLFQCKVFERLSYLDLGQDPADLLEKPAGNNKQVLYM